MPNLAVKEYCTGCTACASACPHGGITLGADRCGFLYPVIDTGSCTNCGLCEKVCPIISPLRVSETEPQVYAAFSVDTNLRLNSSSGGVFSEIAQDVLQHGGIVFGAAYDQQFKVEHICVDCEEDLIKLRGAKYSQSTMLDTLKQVKWELDAGRYVLFSGTPCQVGGVKAFLRKNYDNLLTVDFVCHSVPSPIAWNEYVKYRANHDNNGSMPRAINMRSKITGWTCYQYSNLFEYDDDYKHITESGESLYMKLLVGGYISRECCEHCRFKGYNRVSDLTLGDFWGIWDIAPEMDDNKGTSVVLVHSLRGVELIDNIREDLELKQVTLEEASQQNPAMIKASKANDKREDTFALIRNGEIEKCSEWFVPRKRSVIRKLYSFIKHMVRTRFT